MLQIRTFKRHTYSNSFLCMSKTSKILKTSHNRCILKYVKDVEDRSHTHKGCNAMYVEDGKSGGNRIFQIWGALSGDIYFFFIPKKVDRVCSRTKGSLY